MTRADKYTDPELRERLKQEIQSGDRGGRNGQWSARKAQLLVQEYEKAGGGYRGDKDESAQHLEQWGEQDWRTRGGDADARGESGTSRYLPDVAWKLLSAKERRATDTRKQDGDEQFVANTDAAQEARKAAELLTMNASDAVKAARSMDGASQLERARAAEQQHGKGRKTVLTALEKRLS